ncbi:MAG TPA: hypothetical protein PK986_10165 [Spirochaetota bacterium]|nr:hypothetical protein [Spirochaetota bacterium]
MIKMKMWGSSTTFNDEVIKALKSQEEGEILPDDGVFASIYEQLNGPSIALMVCTDKETQYIYIDNDEFISLVKDARPEWVLGVDKNLVRLMMMYNVNGSQLLISFVYDLTDDTNKNAIKLLVKKKEFNLNYLNMLYGGLVLEGRAKFRLPEHIIDGLKQLK